jgi:sulfur carrier protein ThiS
VGVCRSIWYIWVEAGQGKPGLLPPILLFVRGIPAAAGWKGAEMTFPKVSGSNLLRQKLTLPQDFAGKLNLVFIPFQRWHQAEVDSWDALA